MTAAVDLDGKKVLVIVYGHVADTMAAIPALRTLRHAHPSARIELLLLRAAAPVLERCPYVDELVVWDDFKLKGTRWSKAEKAATLARLALRVRRRRYDAILVFHRSFRAIRQIAAASGASLTVGISSGGDRYTHPAPPPAEVHSSREENRAVLAAIGLEEDGGPIELWTSPEDDARAEGLLGGADGSLHIGLHPGSDWSCQQWLPERFAAAGRTLNERLGATIVVTGSPSEIPLQEEIAAGLSGRVSKLAGTTSLSELVALIRRLDVLITVNSAPAAIAQAVGTPAVVLLGPEDRRLTGLVDGERVCVVQPGTRLAPGSWCEFGRWGVLSGCDSPMCRGVSGLDQLGVDQVAAAAIGLLAAAGKGEPKGALSAR